LLGIASVCTGVTFDDILIPVALAAH
jgi:hypothetical protein